MAHTYTSVLLHVIFSTKNRLALLTPEIRERAFPYMGGMIRELKATALIIKGMEDHIHILTSLPATIALSDFMRKIKGGSSGWINDKLLPNRGFAWQTGYAAFSVSKSNVEVVREYIAKQQEHHTRMTFEEEYLAVLKRHEIEFDPRFVMEQEIVG